MGQWDVSFWRVLKKEESVGARTLAEGAYLKGLCRFNLEGDPFAAWAFVHVAVCFYKLGKREDPSLERQQHAVGGHLVDVTQGALQCDLVLDDAQFRLAGEVADAVHKELDVLLELSLIHI